MFPQRGAYVHNSDRRIDRDDSPQACGSSIEHDQTGTHGDLAEGTNRVEPDHDDRVALCNEDQAGLSDWHRMCYDFVTDATYQCSAPMGESWFVNKIWRTKRHQSME